MKIDSYVILQPDLKRTACRWARHLWWLSARVPRLFSSAQGEKKRCKWWPITPDHPINVVLPVPLRTALPAPPHFGLCSDGKCSLVWFWEDGSGVPSRPCFPWNTKPVWESFERRIWWNVRAVLLMMPHVAALAQEAGLMLRPRLLHIHEAAGLALIHSPLWARRPPLVSGVVLFLCVCVFFLACFVLMVNRALHAYQWSVTSWS